MICLECGNNAKIKFCCRSCSAKYNNKRRKRTKWTQAQRNKFSTKQKGVGKGIKRGLRITEKKMICTWCKSPFISKRYGDGAWQYHTYCSDACYLKIKQKNARGNKKCIYKGQKFDSNWEIIIAQFLDNNNITWNKPMTGITWTDKTNKQHKYFPDFYLPDYDIYLDPKNLIVQKQQQEKLDIVSKQINLIYGDIRLIQEKVVQVAGLEPA